MDTQQEVSLEQKPPATPTSPSMDIARPTAIPSVKVSSSSSSKDHTVNLPPSEEAPKIPLVFEQGSPSFPMQLRQGRPSAFLSLRPEDPFTSPPPGVHYIPFVPTRQPPRPRGTDRVMEPNMTMVPPKTALPDCFDERPRDFKLKRRPLPVGSG